MDGLRESAASKADRFEQEMSTMKDSSSCIRDEWSNHTKKAESHYLEDTAAVESGKKDLDEVLQNWYANFMQKKLEGSLSMSILLTLINCYSLQKAKMGSQQWSNAQESLLRLEKSNVASVDEIVR